MENHYLFRQRIRSAMVCLLLFSIFLVHTSFAQSQSGFDKGVVRIKVSEAFAQQIESAKISRDANNNLITGIQSLDQVNTQFKAKAIRRVFRPAGKFEAKHRRHGLHLWYEIQIDQAASVLSALNGYKSHPQILVSEPSYKKHIIGSDNKNFGPVVLKQNQVGTLPGASNDPLLGSQWHYNNTGQTGGTAGADISLFQAWGIETGRSDVIVAVTDGGVQVNHPDLAANMWVNTDEIPGNNLDDDNNGYIDDVNGYGFGDDTGEIAPDNHGTHVGGTIAAVTNNGIGVAGVAGGSGAGDGVRIMSCAAFGGTSNGGFADTYTYAADNGAVISQNSWGYTNPGAFEQAVLDGIDYFIAEAGLDENGIQVGPMKGGLVVFAAGNSDSNEQHYPGYYDASFAVSGLTHKDQKAWYTNYGAWVEVAAPGGETNSVAQQGVLSTLANNQYGFFQGTSMACPHVSGVAALIISKYGGPGFTPEIIKNRLTSTAENVDALNPGFEGLLGIGRINAFAALQEDDDAAPLAITNLSADSAEITSLVVSWTAPIDSGSGAAFAYDLRYSTSPITEANFESATAFEGEPTPGAPGTLQQVVVNGLAPGTLYYFAIKSSDFFGNVSTISNVAEGTTNFTPSFAVTPSSLTESLVTNQKKDRLITVKNNGEGPLNFWAVNGTHATLSPNAGTVAAHDSIAVSVTLDAIELLAGTYDSDAIFFTNDPAQDTVHYPITLQVTNNGAPIAYLPVTTLDFDTVYLVDSPNVPYSASLDLINNGSDTLAIDSVTSTDPNFKFITGEDPKVAPFETFKLNFIYETDSVGTWTTTIKLYTNDPVNSPLTIDGRVVVVPAPAISVTPDSLYQQLNTDNTATQSLTITNTGGTDLHFTAEVSAGQGVVTSVAKTVTIPAKSLSAKSAASKNNRHTTTGAQSVRLKSVSQSAAVTTVLILSPDDDVTDLETILDGFEDIEADIYPQSQLPSFSAAAIAEYPIVITTNNTKWLENGGVDPVQIGDELANYIDNGGKVISNEFNYSYDDWKLSGRFIDGQYGPFTPSTTDANITTTLGTILQPSHPVIAGVATLNYAGFVQNVGLAPGAVAIANWANGELFVAANSNVVALNLLPSLGNGGALQWSGDLPTLYQNAIHFLSGPGFVSVTPESGTVAAGGALDLTVTFDATGLDAGHYRASIDLATNVPGAELVQVPAILDVLGPEFTVSPDSIYAEAEKGETTTETFTLSNNGFGDFEYEISVVDKGVSSVSVKKVAPVKAARIATPKRTQATNARVKIDIDGTKAMTIGNVANARSASTQLSVDQYATDFENFTEGDITGQDGWAGEWGNWTIESINPSSAAQHFRGLADGFGLSRAFSPEVAIGSEEKSSATMKVNIAGQGVTWQISPQSPSAGFINTRIQFNPDGSASAMTDDGSGSPVFAPISAEVPTGYFDLTIEVERATSKFKVYFNTTVVFEGLGFAGDIEQVVILSLMEIAGPTFDVDDMKIIDGTRDFAPSYISVAPNVGTLGAGESVEVTVTFDASELEFGTYSSAVVVNIADEELTLPTTFRVFGEPAIAVDPTVLQASVAYKEDTVLTFDVKNTGGNPLDYSLQVIGADTDIKKLAKSPVSKFASTKELSRTASKVAKDISASRESAKQKPVLEIRTGLPLFTENFEDATFPPSDWSVVDNAGSGVTWNFASAWGEGNYSGTGEAATASSDAAGEFEFDTELISPWIDAAGYKNIALQYNANYQNYANRDFLNLDIQVAGASEWTNVLSWNEDHGSLRGTESEFVSLELDEFLAGATSFRVRWHYFDPQDGDFDWYAQIDDIAILGDARAWLSVTPASGSVPVRGTETINALFNAEDIEPGFYVAGVLVRSNASNSPLVGIVASLDVLRPSAINVEPDDLKQKLFVGEVATQIIKVSNQGESPLKFALEAASSAGAPEEAKARIVSKDTRITPTQTKIADTDSRAITNGARKLATTELYGTGFEEFATGNINGQLDWAGQFGNWTVEAEKPAFGAQHFRGVADGFGQSLAFSPEVTIGTEAISSTTLKVNIDGSGVTWQVIPQSPSASLVNTRFEISPNGSMRTLVDTLGGTYETVPGTWPSGYTDLRIDVVRATKVFTIYINNAPVFTGKAFAGDIEQVVILSLMEEAGPTIDIDNLAILDGTPAAPWLTVTPLSGTVAGGSSLDLAVTFNAQDLDAGNYADTLNIASNDPATPWVQVPVFLTVDSNTPPVLAPIPALTVLEKEIAQVTISATDEDDSLVTITIDGAPAFVTAASSGNGTATYDIKPTVGDAGEYHIIVTATDARGAIDIDTLHLSVLEFAVKSFSVVNIKTGQVIATFTDEVTLNRADANFNDLNIRANASPLTVGSVKFKVNGSQKNIDNTYEYFLKTNYLSGLGVGQYTLFGEPFTSAYGHGQRGIAKTAIVKIINASTVVTHFSLVNTSTGVVVQDFSDSITIDASRSDFAQLNIRAHTAPNVVGSVKFKIDGTQRNIDNTLTYDLKSQALQTLATGTHTLLGEPWTQNFGQGQRGLGKTATVSIVNGGAGARVAQGFNAETTELSIFPVPVTDQLTIDVAGKKIEGDVELVLVNTLGQLIHRVKVSADQIQGYQINTNTLGMVSGVYYLKLQSVNYRQTKRFNKK
ncbi:S8 family serine peptidase [Pseudochryseolinea flava]|uniref:Fibronectin type-III domain-containing protein n=1 Tax=Pseudochryseolinea flava TaxID=2059302 RepID=A0A364Y0W5_9BACT|nr:S8 family serine peptidase [Pseudochryseolinea flava]RAW00315.1 hypothetical protein DQQ10_14775 [Pseudochryseolinea flava]